MSNQKYSNKHCHQCSSRAKVNKYQTKKQFEQAKSRALSLAFISFSTGYIEHIPQELRDTPIKVCI